MREGEPIIIFGMVSL